MTTDTTLDISNLQQQQQVEQQQQQQVQPINSYKPSNPPKSIIMFDGVCNVCDNFVQFVFPRDEKGRFSYQALQTVKGIEILNYYNIPADLSTVVLIEEETGQYFTKSTAVLRIMYYLQSPYSYLYTFSYVPSFIRDFCYGLFGKYRYLVMGKKDTCFFSPKLRQRFIDWRSPIVEGVIQDENKEM